MEPVPARERVDLLDILRGFAILGMFAVNMTADLPFTDAFWDQSFPAIDRLVLILTALFANGRFITLFSFLFGIGFYIQYERARARGAGFLTVYLRRIVGLFAIGIGTGLLGLYTIILVDYARYGLLLPLFVRRSRRFVVIAAVLMFVAAKMPGAYESYQATRPPQQVVVDDAAGAVLDQDGNTDAVDLVDLHLNGSLGEIASSRAEWFLGYLTSPANIIGDLDILGLFLIGLLVASGGLLHDEEKRKRFARRVLPWLLGISTVCVLTFVYIDYFLSSAWDEPPLVTVKWAIGWPLGMPVMGLAYAAAIALLVDRPGWNSLFRPFKAVGRLALTNYLLTTIVGAAFWYGWGFGLYNQLMPSTGILIAFAVFSIQVIISNWWVKRFRFGPAEWVWRTMTYGKLPPMRIRTD